MRVVVIFLCAFILVSCTKTDETFDIDNCLSTTVNEEQYNLAGNNYNIQSVSFEDGCLSITFTSSGCSGETWNYEAFLQSMPLTTSPNGYNIHVALALENTELCDALITKTVPVNLFYEVYASSSSSVKIYLKGYENNPIIVR